MKNNTIKGKPLNFNVGIQRWYVKELLKLVDDLTKEVYAELKPLYKEYKEQITFTQDNNCHPEFISGSDNKQIPKQVRNDKNVQDASISSQSRIKINSLRDLFEKKFKDRGKTFAERMVRKTNRYANTTFWAMMNDMLKGNEEVKQTGGFLLKGSLITPEKEEVIKALIYENTSLITNIQTHYFEQITGAVMRSITSGLGVGHIEEELNKYRGMTKRRARNIALDQTRKAYNSINLRNMQDAGVRKFEWLHSGGSQRPRKYHMELNGKIFDLDKGAPNKDGTGYIYPGQEPYCHCRMAAVIEFDLE